MRYSSQLRVPEELYEARRDRMKRLLELKAPRIVIAIEAEMLTKCFKISWRWTLESWKLKFTPRWILMIIDKDFRDAAKDDGWVEEFKEEMREMFKKK